MYLFSALGGAIIAGLREIGKVLRDEIAARLRLTEVIREQSRAREKEVNEQLRQKEAVERVAGRRRIGGFATAEIATEVQVRATTAQKQFTQLRPGDINQAFDTFGDVEGLSQQDLIDLSIIAGFGELEMDPRRSRKALKQRADKLLKRFRGRIDIFKGRELVQGQRGAPKNSDPPGRRSENCELLERV